MLTKKLDNCSERVRKGAGYGTGNTSDSLSGGIAMSFASKKYFTNSGHFQRKPGAKRKRLTHKQQGGELGRERLVRQAAFGGEPEETLANRVLVPVTRIPIP